MTEGALEEEGVVSRVEELMQTLDQIKKYNELARSLKKFATFVIGSIFVYIVLRISFVISIPQSVLASTGVLLSIVSLVIPILGVVGGVLYVRGRINSVKMGDWKDGLSKGFPGALKILSELDWEKTFEEISIGKLCYALYVLLKTGAYWVITFLAMELTGDILLIHFLHRTLFLGGFAWGVLSALTVLLVLGNDLVRRYKEIHALDLLLWELRWFSIEFRRAEFQQA